MIFWVLFANILKIPSFFHSWINYIIYFYDFIILGILTNYVAPLVVPAIIDHALICWILDNPLEFWCSLPKNLTSYVNGPYPGTPPLTRFFGPGKNRVKGKPRYRRSPKESKSMFSWFFPKFFAYFFPLFPTIWINCRDSKGGKKPYHVTYHYNLLIE